MNYIIMDFEWNNTYARKTKKFINEVIEIGAVKLDENLNLIDEFSCVIRSQIGKKLRGSVKKLTNITNEEVRSGEPFSKVFSQFKKWVDKDSIVLTWGDGDVRVLIDNYSYLQGIERIPFLYYYGDLQAYIDEVLKVPKAKQIGLSAAAEELNIPEDGYSLHRALDDSRLSAECLKKTFNKEKLLRYVKKCNDEFYARLSFKPYAISNIRSPLIDRSKLSYECEICQGKCEQIGRWSFSNQYFRGKFYCHHCNRLVRVSVRFKKYYDRIDVRKTVKLIEPEQMGPHEDSNCALIESLPYTAEDKI